MDNHYAEMTCGIECLLLLVAVGAVILLARNGREESHAKFKEMENLLSLRECEHRSLTLLSQEYCKRILELECALERTRNKQGKGQQQETKGIVQFTKQKWDQDNFEYKINLLEEEKKLLEQEISGQAKEKRQLEDELRRMKQDYHMLNESATACKQMNDDLNNQLLSKDAQIARLNFQILQQGEVVTTLQEGLRQVTEEKSAMAAEVRKQENKISQYKAKMEDLQSLNRVLREDVARLMKENGNLQCELEEKKLRFTQAEEFLSDKGRRLKEAGKEITKMDDERSQMKTQLWHLRGEKEAVLRDLNIARMRNAKLEELNVKLQKELSVLSHWHDEVCAGLVRTDQDLM